MSMHRFQIMLSRERLIGAGLTDKPVAKQLALGKAVKPWDEVKLISTSSWDSPFHARRAMLKSLLYAILARLEAGELDRLLLDEHEYRAEGEGEVEAEAKSAEANSTERDS